ncbi:hypothetical protein [Macrococcoides caseolyticum]|nr:hypothetical protein [Macrococcus caseolyticus]QPT46473.1 hypothetical protein I6G25_09880 [Macrococcus caseolyticus]QQB04972.1 hypothetical protein I6H62_08205 [Macrococcus caseolyticus]
MGQFNEYLESIQDAQKIEKIIRFNIEDKKVSIHSGENDKFYTLKLIG